MTTYNKQKRRCYCCGKKSVWEELMSSNSFGSPDLDQRPPGMLGSTIDDWLQECPHCGYVAPVIDQGDDSARNFVATSEFRAASLDPLADPESRRFLVRAAYNIHCGDRVSAFSNTLCAAWIAEDGKRLSDAAAFRLKAAGHLEGSRIKSIDIRLILLDVLRRASRWEAVEALASEMTVEKLEYPFAEIVAFHRSKIEAKDCSRYTIAQALGREVEIDD
jgi:hypothetical protein